MGQVLLVRAYDEVVAFFARGPSSDETIARVRELLRKNSAGTLTPDEVGELDQCVQLDRMMLLIRSRARQEAQKARGARARTSPPCGIAPRLGSL